MRRWRAALAALRGKTEHPPAPPAVPVDVVHPLATAVGLVTEALRPGGGDVNAVNALLADVPAQDMPAVAAATAVVASTLAKQWAAYEGGAPAELLRRLALEAVEGPGHAA